MSIVSSVTFEARNGWPVLLRSAQPEDAAELLDVLRIVFRKSAHLLSEVEEFNFDLDKQVAHINAYLAHPDRLMVLPLVAGKIVGCMDFTVGSRRRVSHQGAFGISLIPECQNLGIGRKMIEVLLEWAEANPRVECVRLSVHSKNVRAVQLYRALGFQPEGREVGGVKLSDGVYDDVLLMARSVMP